MDGSWFSSAPRRMLHPDIEIENHISSNRYIMRRNDDVMYWLNKWVPTITVVWGSVLLVIFLKCIYFAKKKLTIEDIERRKKENELLYRIEHEIGRRKREDRREKINALYEARGQPKPFHSPQKPKKRNRYDSRVDLDEYNLKDMNELEEFERKEQEKIRKYYSKALEEAKKRQEPPDDLLPSESDSPQKPVLGSPTKPTRLPKGHMSKPNQKPSKPTTYPVRRRANASSITSKDATSRDVDSSLSPRKQARDPRVNPTEELSNSGDDDSSEEAELPSPIVRQRLRERKKYLKIKKLEALEKGEKVSSSDEEYVQEESSDAEEGSDGEEGSEKQASFGESGDSSSDEGGVNEEGAVEVEDSPVVKVSKDADLEGLEDAILQVSSGSGNGNPSSSSSSSSGSGEKIEDPRVKKAEKGDVIAALEDAILRVSSSDFAETTSETERIADRMNKMEVKDRMVTE